MQGPEQIEYAIYWVLKTLLLLFRATHQGEAHRMIGPAPAFDRHSGNQSSILGFDIEVSPVAHEL